MSQHLKKTRRSRKRRRSKNKQISNQLPNNTFVCVKCLKTTELNERFTWTFCYHEFCVECASNIINESLSLSNEIPTCIYPECNQLLSNQHADSIKFSLSQKYQIKLPVHQYNNNEYLIYGYIRNIQLNIPTDIILSILNYFSLIYYTKITCYSCQGYGYIITNCTKCDGKGMTSYCECCEGAGFIKDAINCDKCESTGFQNCRRCYGAGYYLPNGNCIKCNGCGTIKRSDKSSDYCWDCSGTGIDPFLSETCTHCRGSGKSRRRKCSECGGKACFVREHQCWICNGSGRKRSKDAKNCVSCNKSGRIKTHCYGCNGNKQIVVLDFNKLVHHQSWCNKCFNWFPDDIIIRWTGCSHSYCFQCISKYVREYGGGQGCVVKGCQMMIGDDLDLLGDMFLCKGCDGWHLDIKQSIFEWSKCRHEYERNCAQKYIDDAVKKLYIPSCRQINCDQSLTLIDAARFGISKKQYKKLKSKIEKGLSSFDECS